MSLFKYFGKNKNKNKNKDKNSSDSKKEANAAVNDGIVALNAHVARLEKVKAHTNKKIDTLTREAQEAVRKKDKQTALHKIKLRKQLQNRVEKLDGQITNLELEALAMDDTLVNANYMDAMSNAARIMKDLVNDEMIEKAEQTKEELEHQLDIQADLNKVLSEPLQYGDPIDDDEIEKQLEMLQQEDDIDDIDSQYFLYQHNKNKNKNKNKNTNKNKNKLVSSTTDETDVSDDIDVDLNGNNNNNNKNNGNLNLTAEEEKELKELELEENVLLTREIRLSSSADSGTTFDVNNETQSESDSESDSDMELVTDNEEMDRKYEQENKGKMIVETSKQKRSVLMVTSGASRQCFDSLHKSAMILCH